MAYRLHLDAVMKRLLVVMTPSRSSRFALAETIKFARKSGAKICLVRVVNVTGRPLARAERWLADMELQVPKDLREGSVTLVGATPDAIAHACEAYSTDAIVLASRTKRALYRLVPPTSDFDERAGHKIVVVREPHRWRSLRPTTTSQHAA